MTIEQALVYAVIGLTLAMLAFEVWRYDLAALTGMILLVLLGTITVDEAFAGFGHPAVVTIAAVLVVSRGLQNTGVTDQVARWMTHVGKGLGLQLAVLCSLIVVSSAFMNNIAALAIFIPVAVRLAMKSDRPTSLYLLPMAFSSHFGGLVTLIGTPTNLIVSGLRMEYLGDRFGMFAFAPVGLSISVVGVLFITLVGWRLTPRRQGQTDVDEEYEMADYLTEIVVCPGSKLTDLRLREINTVTDAQFWIAAILRDGDRISNPTGTERLRAEDDLLVRGGASDIRQLIYDTGVELREAKPIEEGNGSTSAQQPTNLWEDLKARINSDDIDTIEVVVSPDSLMVGKTARTLNLRERYGVNLLAISRYNESLRRPVGSTPFRPGDVLLLQTHHQHLSEALHDLGCLPLAERELNLEPRNLILGIGIFVAALVTASLNILPVPTAMMSAAIAMVMTGVLTLREAYRSVQWPIVILLGSMLSLGVALEQTGGDQLIANQILKASSFASPAVLLVAIMLATMMLSDIVNNAASVVLMASIAVNVARGLGVSLDPFLVAVAVGGACAFLTPVGHEANVLVFDVGGYEFGDYWRLGLPLELLITAVTVPILLLLWPL
ncbi:MAG: SLC13 family permease [Anaerolineales bacterium]|nr:SLC13 family permease [Anaerolineales bacterium]